MELQEVYNLQAWVEREISGHELIQKYSALHQALQQNAKRAQNQQPVPFNEQKRSLLDTLKLVDIFGLSNPQLHVLDTLNISQHIGKEASEQIKNMMTEYASDLAYIAEQINKSQTELQQGIQQINSIFTSLTPIITDEELVLPKNLILTRVTFKNEASIDDINDLRKWTIKLFNITRGLSIACNKQKITGSKITGSGLSMPHDRAAEGGRSCLLPIHLQLNGMYELLFNHIL